MPICTFDDYISMIGFPIVGFASIRTSLHFIPDFRPFLAPAERPPAGSANFLRQIRFLDHLCHGLAFGAER